MRIQAATPFKAPPTPPKVSQEPRELTGFSKDLAYTGVGAMAAGYGGFVVDVLSGGEGGTGLMIGGLVGGSIGLLASRSPRAKELMEDTVCAAGRGAAGAAIGGITGGALSTLPIVPLAVSGLIGPDGGWALLGLGMVGGGLVGAVSGVLYKGD